MNLTRVAEIPIEARGPDTPVPGSVKDWQADRLANALLQVEKVFEQAIAEQQKTAPVNSDVLVQVKATISDIQKAGSRDAKSADELAESAERFLTSSEVMQTLPDLIRDGADTELIAGQIAQVANREFAKSSFYGISQDACSSDARLDAMCDRAHALVKAGYIGEKELQGVQVALADPASAKARAAVSFVGIAKSAGIPMVEGEKEVARSLFVDDTSKLGPMFPKTKPTIYVSAEESTKLFGSDPAAAAKTFSHELGHWLARDKSPAMLAAGVDGVKSAGGVNAAHVDAFFKASDLKSENLDMLTHKGGGLLTQELRTLEVNSETTAHISWTKTVKEMQGDLMSLAVENAVSGKGAALDSAHKLASVRDLERLDALAQATEQLREGAVPTLVRFGEEHHTSAAVREFAERIRNGDLDKVQTPQQLDKLMGESIVRGLIQEYTMVRGAELNIHHIENGKAVPGPPAGVDIKSVLAAEMNSKLDHVPGMPTYLLNEKPVGVAANGASAVALEVAGRTGDSGQSLWLTTNAPEGVSPAKVEKELQEFQGRVIAGPMLPLAKEALAASRGKELGVTAPGSLSDTAEATKLAQFAESGAGQKPPAPEGKAEAAQPAPAMSM